MDKHPTPNICILGAGYAGLTVAIELRRRLKWNSFTIYEKNADIGGAWFSNTYPGAESDIQTHLYSWSFEQNPNWSRNYASQQEILKYMKDVAEKYGLYKRLRLNTEVDSVTWDEGTYKWRLISRDVVTGEREERAYDFVFSGLNFLWQPNKPRVFEAFAGPCVHTAEWDHTLKFDGKVVGVVGSGASAVQIIPQIAAKTQLLHSFQRNRVWALPKKTLEFRALTKWLFRNVPFVMTLYRWWLYWELDGIAGALEQGSKASKNLTAQIIKSIEEQTKGNPEAFKQLLPDYVLGCRVPTFSGTYFATLASDKVKVHTSKIVEVKSNGIVTEDGTETNLDILILGTGFKSQEFFGPMKIIGINRINVLEVWKKDRPRNYLGVFSSLAPNLFFIGGPYGILATAVAQFPYEIQASLVVKMLRKMYNAEKRYIVVKDTAEEEYMRRVDEGYANHVSRVVSNCHSWMKNARGDVTSFAPFTGVQYWREAKAVNRSQFIIK